jgi:prefoldin subunit 5
MKTEKSLEQLSEEYENIRKEIYALKNRTHAINKEIMEIDIAAGIYHNDEYIYEVYTLEEISLERIEGKIALKKLEKLNKELYEEIPAKIEALKKELKAIAKEAEEDYEVLIRLK